MLLYTNFLKYMVNIRELEYWYPEKQTKTRSCHFIVLGSFS